MQAKLPLPLGTTDFKRICYENYYVDKTLLVKDLLDEKNNIILFTRPRRFGKTLNMDMLRTFFEKTEQDTSIYFKNKAIWQQGEKYTAHQAKYPVIYITLKDIKSDNWNTALSLLKKIIRAEYARHIELLNSDKLSIVDAETYRKIIKNEADDADYMLSLHDLSKMLYDHHQIKPIIIIDEYDTPIQESFVNNYYNKAVEFTRNFFSAALKDNPNITMSILTGILRIAKESIFSGLNNISVYSVLDTKFSTYFGFTEAEVQVMAAYYDSTSKVQELKAWYDGYKFGNIEIYNPWSVLNYLSRDCQPQPFWVQTSGNSVIHETIKNINKTASDNLRKLLTGEIIKSVVQTNIIHPKLKEPQANVLGFLLMTGYLKSTRTVLNERGAYVCELSIPNKEIASIYYDEILALLTNDIGEDIVYSLQEAIVNKNIATLKATLGRFLRETISFYDGMQENYYHGLLLGMTIMFEKDYYPLSNRESGDGRYDIGLFPKNATMPGIIIEIKATNSSSKDELNKLAKKALKQIEAKKYDTEMLARGIQTIHKYGVAFCKKDVEIVTN